MAEGLYDGAGEREFEELAAETAAYQASMQTYVAKLAERVAVTRLHRHSSDSFIETLRRLRERESTCCTNVWRTRRMGASKPDNSAC